MPRLLPAACGATTLGGRFGSGGRAQPAGVQIASVHRQQSGSDQGFDFVCIVLREVNESSVTKGEAKRTGKKWQE